jgi:hypothetical protein
VCTRRSVYCYCCRCLWDISPNSRSFSACYIQHQSFTAPNLPTFSPHPPQCSPIPLRTNNNTLTCTPSTLATPPLCSTPPVVPQLKFQSSQTTSASSLMPASAPVLLGHIQLPVRRSAPRRTCERSFALWYCWEGEDLVRCLELLVIGSLFSRWRELLHQLSQWY